MTLCWLYFCYQEHNGVIEDAANEEDSIVAKTLKEWRIVKLASILAKPEDFRFAKVQATAPPDFL